MVKVRTGRALCACISATTVEESMPPERKAPSGTSATIWPCSDWRMSASVRSTASSGVPANGLRSPSAAIAAASQ